MTTPETFDENEYKTSVREEWVAAAAGWRKWFETSEAPDAGPVLTDVLLGDGGVRSGDSVLDVGSGYGEPGLTAARLAGPAGFVTCLDISGDMLAFAEERARKAGITNARFVEADIEHFELEPHSLDAVVSRATLMYAADPLSTLRRLRSALRPGGRLGVAVWGTPPEVAFAAPVPVMAERLGFEPTVDGPGPFALGEPGQLEDLATRAGFGHVTSGSTVVTYELASPEACTEWLRDVAPPIANLVAGQPRSVQDDVWSQVTKAWEPFQGEDGHVRLPCTARWVRAENVEVAEPARTR